MVKWKWKNFKLWTGKKTEWINEWWWEPENQPTEQDSKPKWKIQKKNWKIGSQSVGPSSSSSSSNDDEGGWFVVVFFVFQWSGD